jgi:hypothetical protein
MVMSKQFAPEYPRTEEGWIRFPTDSEYRKQMFPPEVNKHPAKANVYLVQSIIEYVSEIGQILLDIMAGTGTLMVGALVGREIICVEISELFHNLQQLALSKLEEIAPGISEHIMLINLPCQKYLPIPNLADHIIFSPQYAGIMKTKGTDSWNVDTGYEFAEYSKDPLNLGVMSDFIWSQEMGRIYSKCYNTVKPGGTMVLIVKDHMEKGKRVQLVQRAIDESVKAGFTHDTDEHFKWAAPGMPYTAARRAKGIEVVDDESIIVLRKGG